MKRLFTLVAGMLLVGSTALAQEKWTDLVVNGDMEGAADPLWSSFWCHDWREGVEFDPASEQTYDDAGQFQGFAEIVEDPISPGNHCARVYVRSQAEAQEAGNMVEANGEQAGWDSQFFVYVKNDDLIPLGIPVNKEVRLTMRVRADWDAEGTPSAGTQAHEKPGNYNHYVMAGNVSFSKEWKEFSWEGSISADQVGGVDDDGNPTKGMYSIALNLADFHLGYTAYFDDIKLEIKDPEPPKEVTGWFDLLINGNLENDLNYQYQYNNPGAFTFTGRDGITGTDAPARLMEDPVYGGLCYNVTTIAYNSVVTTTTKETDPETGEEYEVESEKQVYIPEGSEEPLADDQYVSWRSQFFIATNHVFKRGEKFRFKISARADKEAVFETQIHRKQPGDYLHWEMLGNINVNEEWQTFEFEQEITDAQAGGSTIAFNLNTSWEEPVNFYFRDFEFCLNEAEITDEDLILFAEDVKLPFPENIYEDDDDVVYGTIDMSKMMEVLGINDAIAFVGGQAMKVKTEEGFTDAMEADVTVDVNGNYSEDGLNIAFDEEKSEGNNIVFSMANFSLQYDPTKPVTTKILFKGDKWEYLFNVTFSNTPDQVAGDANEDGVVDVRDMSAILAAILNNTTDSLPKSADVTGDGVIDVRDMSAVLNIILGNN